MKDKEDLLIKCKKELEVTKKDLKESKDTEASLMKRLEASPGLCLSIRRDVCISKGLSIC